MILKDDAFVIRQNFGRKLSFSEQLFSILSRIFEDLTWIFSWIWTLTKSRLNAIKKNKQNNTHKTHIYKTSLDLKSMNSNRKIFLNFIPYTFVCDLLNCNFAWWR